MTLLLKGLQRTGLFALILSLAGPLVAAQQPELSRDRIATIAKMLPAQPAGFGVACSDRTAWAKSAALFPEEIKHAETLVTSPLPPWNDEAYLRYSRDGDRNEGQVMLSRHTGQLTPLVLAECGEWKGRFLPRIAEQLDAISAEKSWTLPAHDPALVNFHGTHYYVDLNAAALGHNVAEALYLLGDKIPAATRQRAMDALELHVFGPMRRAYAGQEKTYISWLDTKHNWNSVCHNGVTDAALTILPDRNDRALFAAAAEHWVPNYIDSFSDSGYDTEGIGYWVYGFENYAMLREHLWYSTGGKIDLFNDAKARRAALFGFQFAMMPGIYADFGDAHYTYKPDKTFLAWVDRTFALGMFPDDLAIVRSERFGSLADAILAAFPLESQRHDPGATADKLIGLRTWYPEPGILVARPSGNQFAVTVKAGGNGNHSHNDVGAFTIALGTKQVVGDPGGPGYYTASTFSSHRYDSKLLNSYGHPVPQIDGSLQLEATTVHPTVLSSSFTPERDTVAMDLTPAYKTAHLQKLTRTLTYSRSGAGSVEIADRFEIAAPTEIVEPLPTHGAWKQIDSSTLAFDDGDAHLIVTLAGPASFTVSEEKINDPNNGNPFTRVAAAIHLEHSGTVTMHFHPAPAK
ncbi:MAG: heparinase II/III family protein [Terracidiphilus sp.]|nr:heparinase II/III family protein [Terracidiphilus sp.]